MKRVLAVNIFLYLLLLCCLICIPVEASYGNEASTGHGVMMKNGGDSIYLQATELNFHIKDLAYNQETSNYVEANYTLKNMSSSTYNATFYLPIEDMPKQSSTQLRNLYQLKNKDTILIPEIRHTYSNGFVSAPEELNRLMEDYKEDSFFKRDLPVHHYKIQLSNLDATRRLECRYTYSFDPATTKLFTGSLSSYYKSECTIGVYAEPFLDFYFAGEDVEDFLSNLKLYDLVNGIEYTEANIILMEKNQLSFETLALLNYDERSDISPMDWYNAIFDHMQDTMYYYDSIKDISCLSIERFIIWLKYDISFLPNETIFHTVRMPVYLYHTTSSYGVKYSFQYLGFFNNPGSIDLHIYTEYYMDTLITGFKRTSYGYELNEGKFEEYSTLYFSLQKQNNFFEADGLDYFMVIFLYLLFIFPLVGLLIFFYIDKKRFVRGISYLTLILSYSMGYAGFLAISFMLWSFFYVSYALLAILVLILFIELLIMKRNNLIQLLATFVVFVFSTISLVQNNIEAASFICFSLGFPLIVCSFVHLLRLGNKDVYNKKKHQYLPVGYYSSKSFYIMIALFLVCIIIASIVSSFLSQILPSVVCFIIILSFLFLSFIGISLGKTYLFDYRELRMFFKDLDIEKLEVAITKKLSNPKINPETKNYLYLLFSNYALVYSKPLYEKYRAMLFVPKVKSFQRVYDVSTLHLFLPKEEFENTYEQLRRNYYNKKSVLQMLKQFRERTSPLRKEKVDIPLNKLYPLKGNNNFKVAINTFLLIYAYRQSGNEEMAVKQEQAFRSKYAMMQELIAYLDKEE